MKAPGTAYDDSVIGRDPQPAHMRDFVVTQRDNGGVHINSGIPNRAFYLLAVALGGYAWETAGRIWYDSMCDPRLTTDAGFSDFAALTAETAGRLYDTSVSREVIDAWRRVGVTPASTTRPLTAAASARPSRV